MSPIWLTNFPLPPSVNEYLMPIAGGWATSKTGKTYRKGRWVKTKIHTDYVKHCELWAKKNAQGFNSISNDLKKAVMEARENKKRICFRVDAYFIFHEPRIWTVNNIPEQLDADNRLKPCRDALAKILDIDDKYFFSGFFEKVTAPSKDQECTFIRITETIPKDIQDIRSLIKKD